MNLFIGNLNPETTISKLETLFSDFGPIVSAKIIIDKATGVSKGFGFVEFGDRFHAFDAIDNLDATFFDGNIISVKEAKQNNTKGGNSGGGFKSFKPRTNSNNRRPGFNSNPNTNFNSNRY